jgi:hypothetical protein
MHTLSIRDNQNRLNKKTEQNLSIINNIEKSELFQNISEINIFQNLIKNKEKMLDKLKNEKSQYNVNKIIYIQKWWKNIFSKKQKLYNSISNLIKVIKKLIVEKSYNSIKSAFPTKNYYFYKWHSKMIKRIILKQIISNRYQIQKNKKINKEKLNPLNDSKKNKNIHTNKKKIISININNENSKKKENNNNYCQTTKNNNLIINNNKINFNANYLNNKKYVPYSPKVTLKNERFSSPMNKIKQNLNKNSLSKRVKKNHSKLFKNEINIGEKKQKEMKPKKILNKISERKNKKKNNRERIIQQKRFCNLEYIISHNNSKNDAKSIYEENKSVLITNPNSRFNNYILNFNKKEGTVFHNYKKETSEYNNKGVEQNYKTNTHNKNSNKSQYFITEANSNKFDNLFKNKDNKLNSKIYENCLNKYKNYCSQEKIKIKTDINNNNNNENIVKKKSNNIPINKYVILHKKEKEKKIINKEFSNHKKNINIYNSVNNSQTPLIRTSANCSRISSIDNNSIKEKNIYVRNLGVSIFFNFWKEFVDKKAILLKLTKFSKFVNLLNHYQVKILMKDFMQKLLLFRRKKESLENYIKKLIFKMILNLIKQINEYKKHNMKEIKIFKKDLINNKYSNFYQEEGDFVNNINIKSYFDCEGNKFHKKRKSKSPDLLSKLDEFKTTTFSCNINSNLNININSNNDLNNDNNNNRRYTLANSYTDKILDMYNPTIYSDENYNYFNNNNDINNDKEE